MENIALNKLKEFTKEGFTEEALVLYNDWFVKEYGEDIYEYVKNLSDEANTEFCRGMKEVNSYLFQNAKQINKELPFINFLNRASVEYIVRHSIDEFEYRSEKHQNYAAVIADAVYKNDRENLCFLISKDDVVYFNLNPAKSKHEIENNFLLVLAIVSHIISNSGSLMIYYPKNKNAYAFAARLQNIYCLKPKEAKMIFNNPDLPVKFKYINVDKLVKNSEVTFVHE